MSKSDKIFRLLTNEKRGRFSILFGGSRTDYCDKETVEDVVKYFYSCWNSVAQFIYDHKTETFYHAQQNKKEDVRGNINHTWISLETKEVVFNEDSMTKPLDKFNSVPITSELQNGFICPNGQFYECGHEAHRNLAKELFWTETIEATEEEDNWEKFGEADKYLESRGWIKIGDNRRINHAKSNITRNRMTAQQKKAVQKYLEVHDRAEYTYNWSEGTPVKEILKDMFGDE